MLGNFSKYIDRQILPALFIVSLVYCYLNEKVFNSVYSIAFGHFPDRETKYKLNTNPKIVEFKKWRANLLM
jgi:hypothetical protein